jgi:hypothetical protein
VHLFFTSSTSWDFWPTRCFFTSKSRWKSIEVGLGCEWDGLKFSVETLQQFLCCFCGVRPYVVVQ